MRLVVISHGDTNLSYLMCASLMFGDDLCMPRPTSLFVKTIVRLFIYSFSFSNVMWCIQWAFNVIIGSHYGNWKIVSVMFVFLINDPPV